MNSASTYILLEKKCLPFIQHYKNDLLKHDRRTIFSDPGIPFLHFTGDTGTYLIQLHKEGKYPAKGEIVPYLFGHANREHLLSEVFGCVQSMRTLNRQDLILYFNGKKLVEISQDNAERIASSYTHKIFSDWGKL